MVYKLGEKKANITREKPYIMLQVHASRAVNPVDLLLLVKNDCAV
jgi:hypothetical protein